VDGCNGGLIDYICTYFGMNRSVCLNAANSPIWFLPECLKRKKKEKKSDKNYTNNIMGF